MKNGYSVSCYDPTVLVDFTDPDCSDESNLFGISTSRWPGDAYAGVVSRRDG